ncbi:MAG: TylF/MycF/NovP-related O-methyltransferase [Pseudomonadota bacterium]
MAHLRNLRDAAVKTAIRMAGPRRVLYSVQRAAPELVGSYVTCDYPKHLHDPAFMAVASKSNAFTLVDVLRRHELWSLVRQSGKLAPGNYLEVGVWRGGTGLVIAEAVRHFGVGGDVYLADTFSGVVAAGEHDTMYVGGEHADTSEALVGQLLADSGHDQVRILKGMFPDDTGNQFEGAIRLLHIDVDVYESAKGVMDWAFDRIVTGGIIVFDDYGYSTCSGITKLCEEYEVDDRFFFMHNWNGHCVLIKR